MESLLNPKSIAIVGASEKRNRATSVIRNLQKCGFAGGIYPINPKYNDLGGLPCYPSVSAVPGGVDSVVVVIPADGVPAVLQDAYDAGTRAAVILSSGFGEGGLEQRPRTAPLYELSRKGMLICGPNCYGVHNLRSGAAAFSGPLTELRIGHVGIISQSGSFSSYLSQPLMEERGIGCSYVISCGNQIGVSIEEYMLALLEDTDTRVIGAFVEEFRKPHLLAQVGALSRQKGKPIVVLKSGRSESGQAAVLSHTGSMAGSPKVLSALLRRHGIIQATSIDEVVDLLTVFAVAKPDLLDYSRSILAVNGSGGESSHVADAADDVGFAMSPLSEVTKKKLRSTLPDFAVVNSPVDAAGIFNDSNLFPSVLKIVLTDPQEGPVAMNLHNTRGATNHLWHGFAAAMAEAGPTTPRLLLGYTSVKTSESDRKMIEMMHPAGVPYLSGTQAMVRTLDRIWDYRYNLRRPIELAAPPRPGNVSDLPGGALPFMDARNVLAEFDVPMIETRLVKSVNEAMAAAETLGYPVVLKAEATGLTHKSDVGAVALGILNASQLKEKYADIVANIRKAGHSLDGMLVQPMRKFPVETVVGAVVDPKLGPAVMFGLGGVFVEILDDNVLEVAPISRARAKEMILGIRAAKLLQGARGSEPADVEALAGLIVAVSDFVLANQDRLISLDLNPVMVAPAGGGVLAVDAVVELREAPR